MLDTRMFNIMGMKDFEQSLLKKATANGSIEPLSKEFAATIVAANLIQTSSGPRVELTFKDDSRRLVNYDFYGRADRRRIPVASLRWKTTANGYTVLTTV